MPDRRMSSHDNACITRGIRMYCGRYLLACDSSVSARIIEEKTLHERRHRYILLRPMQAGYVESGVHDRSPCRTCSMLAHPNSILYIIRSDHGEWESILEAAVCFGAVASAGVLF